MTDVVAGSGVRRDPHVFGRDADVAPRLRAVVDTERRRAGVPGCAVVVVRRGRVLLNEGLGRRDLEADLPVTSRTLFPIGSATKTFTAAVLAGLADEGRLDFDAPVRTYLPGFALQDPTASQSVSTRDCLSHRTGLPRHDVLWQAGDGVLTRRDIVAALAHLPASKPFRQDYQYNNLLYIAAGELARVLSGSAYEDAVAARILRPLGMNRSNFSVAATEVDPDHAVPYLPADEDDEPHRVPFARLDLAGPAGGINSCADDMVPWLLTLTGRGVDDRAPLLSEEVLAQMRAAAVAMPVDGTGPVTPLGYGLGLMLEDYRGRRVSHHGGNIDGFSCQVLTRDDDVGIAVLTNLHATSLRDSLPYLVLDVLDGVESPDHGAFFRDRLAAKLAAAAEQARSAPLVGEAPTSPVRPLSDYAGRYRHPGYGECSVDDVSGDLAWTYRGLPTGLLTHRQGTVFDITTRLNGVQTTFPAQFDGRADGIVRALLVVLEPEVPPIRFERVRA